MFENLICDIKLKKTIMLIILIILVPFFVFSQKDESIPFSVNDFYENPFEDSAFVPQITETLKELQSTIGPYEIKEEELLNRHNKKVIDKKIFLQSKSFFVYYYFATQRQEYLLKLFQISENAKKLKYSIYIGMTKEDIIQICGNYDSKQIFTKNYELIYECKFPFSGSVQFSFNFEDTLIAINLWDNL